MSGTRSPIAKVLQQNTKTPKKGPALTKRGKKQRRGRVQSRDDGVCSGT